MLHDRRRRKEGPYDAAPLDKGVRLPKSYGMVLHGIPKNLQQVALRVLNAFVHFVALKTWCLAQHRLQSALNGFLKGRVFARADLNVGKLKNHGCISSEVGGFAMDPMVTAVRWAAGEIAMLWCYLPGVASFILQAMKLHNYFRSSASFRVRIALALKGLAYDYVPVNLAAGEQLGDAYGALAADALVPMLEVDGLRLSQSMAIIEYLDETRPALPLLPVGALGRQRVRALAQSIACEIHPLNNLRVLKYLVGPLQQDEATKVMWYRHWVRVGLEALERQLTALDAERAAQGLTTSSFCYGDAPTMADCVLVPQIFNGQRFDVSFDGLPRVMAAFYACMELAAFKSAQPSRCPDFVS